MKKTGTNSKSSMIFGWSVLGQVTSLLMSFVVGVVASGLIVRSVLAKELIEQLLVNFEIEIVIGDWQLPNLVASGSLFSDSPGIL